MSIFQLETLLCFFINLATASSIIKEETTCKCLQENCQIVLCTTATSENIFSFLKDKDKLRNLTVTNSTLNEDLWSFICNISTLEYLDVSSNGLLNLPSKCFKNMKHLTTLKAESNKIQYLQDDVFEGLESLQYLTLENNNISYIEPTVFTKVSNFSTLKMLDLSSNQLTTLDAWPLALGLTRGYVNIYMRNNTISTITNLLNFTLDCSNKFHFSLDLSLNSIQHIYQFYENWNRILKYVPCAYAAFTDIRLLDNPIACDCRDYVFLSIKRKQTYIHFMNIDSCHGNPVASIDLTSTICEVIDNCPNKCRCYQRPYNSTVVVDCSKANIQTIPSHLPSRKSLTYYYNYLFQYELIFPSNSIQTVSENSTMFKHAASLDLNNGNISTITDGAWKLMRKISVIYLHNNKLSTLSKEVGSLNLSTSRISLHDNPWSCSCENAWMQNWFVSIKEKLIQKTVLCSHPEWHAGKDIITVDFCYQPPFNYKSLVIVLISLLASIAIITTIVLLVWRKYKLEIFHRYGFRFIFDKDECEGEDMKYDVFLSSSEHDTAVAKEILERLESYGFKVMFHLRDFAVGVEIIENITAAINSSKRTLCLVSSHFLSSYWCMEEFKIAYVNDLTKSKNRLLVVLIESIKLDSLSYCPEFQTYLIKKTYLEMSQIINSCSRNLLYSLPTVRTGLTSI